MRLRELILVNWGIIPDGSYRFLGTTCLVGETGAGKTSVLDAMIAIMTGGSSRLGKLNSASDDGKGSRKKDAIYRTIESYILGGNNSLFARPSANGYAALVFEPDDSESSKARVVTAILAASAYKKASTLGDRTQRATAERGALFLVTIEGAAVELEDFYIERTANTQECVKVAEIGKRLKDRYQDRKTGVFVTVHRSEEHAQYLRRLYGLLEGRQEASLERANTQATIWSKFVSQEHIQDISEFVRDFVLPSPSDFEELSKISMSVRASRKLKEQAKLLVERIENLKIAEARGKALSQEIVRAKAYDATVARRAYNEALAASRRAELSIQQARRRRDEAQETITRLMAELAGYRNDLTAVEAKLLGIPSYAQHKELAARLGELELLVAGLVAGIHKRATAFERLTKQVGMLEAVATKIPTHKPLATLIAAALGRGVPRPEAMSRLADACLSLEGTTANAERLKTLAGAAAPVEEAVAQLTDLLSGEDKALRSQATTAIANLMRSVEALKEKIADKEEDVRRIEHGNTIRYPRIVEDTLDFLRETKPEAEAMVLCDLVVRVRDEAWQAAIEGYLGNARFRVLVKPEHEEEVNLLLEARKKSGKSTASVIQGDLARKDAKSARTPDTDSIVHELDVDNPHAKAFLEMQYGGVIKVKSARDLKRVRQGLTIDGYGSGGYSTFPCEAGDLTFGKAARALRRQKRLEEIQVLNSQVATIQAEIAAIAPLVHLETTLEMLRGNPIGALTDKIGSSLAEIQNCRTQIKLIDTTDARTLEQQKAALVGDIEAREAEKDKLLTEKGGHEATIKTQTNIKAAQDGLTERHEGERVDATRGLAMLVAQAPWIQIEAVEAEADALVEDVALTLDDLRARRDDTLAKLGEMRALLVTSIGQYNGSAGPEEQIEGQGLFGHEIKSASAFTEVSKVMTRILDLSTLLRSSKLAQLQVQIEQIADSLREAFSTHFCNRLLREIRNGEETVRKLNGELAHHRFGRDTFRFSGEWMSELYRDRHDFLEFVSSKSAEETFNMFSEGALAPKHAATRDEILNVFLAAADEGGKAALMQIGDYRQYRRYDLLKVTEVAGKEHSVSVSLQMTDSGGEKETGLFIARVATLTGGLGLREPGPHLKTVVVDELFKKTDEIRIRAAVEYLSSTLGLHVVFAMPTRAVGPFKDIIDSEYAVTRMKSDELIGEIDHFVVVEHHVYNKVMMAQLKEEKRVAVVSQARLDFAEKEREEAKAA